MLNKIINNYFGFNKQQRNGLLVLVAISFVLLMLRLIYPCFIVPEPMVIKNLPLVERKLDSAFERAHKHYKSTEAYTAKAGGLFTFDPNTVSMEQLLQLGFREKTAVTFLKFRSKGFVFREKKDLQKVYGISDRFYAELAPYILIKDQKNTVLQKPGDKPVALEEPAPRQAPVITKVELNSADSTALVALKGIGPGYAKRILKYRSILGGYVSAEQLKEVYGFTEELYAAVRPMLSVNTALVKKIDLNKDDFKTINKHPYLSYALTKLIFDWRRKTIITPVNLKDILNDELLYNKLLPYLAFD